MNPIELSQEIPVLAKYFSNIFTHSKLLLNKPKGHEIYKKQKIIVKRLTKMNGKVWHVNFR